MNSNAALCLLFELGKSDPGFSSNSGSDPNMIEQSLSLLKRPGEVLQFCVSQDWLEANPKTIATLKQSAAAVDGLLEGPAGDWSRQVERLSAVFTRCGLSWWGVALSQLAADSFRREPQAFRQVEDQGSRWVSIPVELIDFEKGVQPIMAAPDCVKIPNMAFDPAVSADGAPVEFNDLPAVLAAIERTAQEGLVCVINITSLLQLDGQQIRQYLLSMLDQARQAGVPLVSLNTIADVVLARTQAGKEARERVSFQQFLHYQDYWDQQIATGQQIYKVYDYRGGWRLKPGFYRHVPEGWKRLTGPDQELGFSINQHGLRGEFFTHAKPFGEKRVIALGDSCVFGIAGEKNPWPAQMEHRLLERIGNDSIRVINAGIEGQSSIHCLMRLDRLLTFEPDIVLVSVAANDLFIEDPARYLVTVGHDFATPWEIVGEYPRSRPAAVIGLTERSMTLDTFYPYSYAYHLSEMVQKCRAAGVQIALMTLPCLVPVDLSLVNQLHRQKTHYPPFVREDILPVMRRLYDIYNAAVRKLAHDEDVLLVDVEGFFAQEYDDQRHQLFSDTCHPTGAGNRLIGRLVADRIWPMLET